MKKQTKRMIWVIFIVLVMFGSSFAFIVISVVPEEKKVQIEPPTQFVSDDYINETLKEYWISLGYTIMEFHYYEGCCQDIQFYVDALPQELEQLVVEKIKDGSNPRIIAASRFGVEERNVTTANQVVEALCKVLVKPPVDCGLIQMNVTAS